MRISKIVFMGTPEFAVPILKKLTETGYKPQLVITQPDRPKGRKRKLTAPAVKIYAESQNIEVWQPEKVNDEETLSKLESLQPELIITAAYGEYLGKKVRKLPTISALNIHPSLLPKYRGATPVNAALFSGEEETGVSIFRLVGKMDAGPILSQSFRSIELRDNYTELLEKLSHQGAEDLINLIHDYEKGIVKETKQNIEEATYCHKLMKTDYKINWSDKAEKIYNQVRALSRKPGAETVFRNNKMKLIEIKKTGEKTKGEPGEIQLIKKKQGIVVNAGDEEILILELQPAGKKIMSAYSYHLGARIQKGEFFK